MLIAYLVKSYNDKAKSITYTASLLVANVKKNYTASGQIEKATTKETILLILFAVGGKVIGNFYQQPIPITPAGSITVTANNVLTPELPSTYANIVAISDTIHIKDMYACAITYIGY
ncbi:19422_t:CDS:2 [Rhizophagus irregularis]|nr:19422_t:CDS:2 [Rhizophagus irregularis]